LANQLVRLWTKAVSPTNIRGMNTFTLIRRQIGATQAEMAKALEMSQGNVSFLERGQTVTPKTAEKLIQFAATRGVTLTYDHVYGGRPLPNVRKVRAAR